MTFTRFSYIRIHVSDTHTHIHTLEDKSRYKVPEMENTQKIYRSHSTLETFFHRSLNSVFLPIMNQPPVYVPHDVHHYRT